MILLELLPNYCNLRVNHCENHKDFGVCCEERSMQLRPAKVSPLTIIDEEQRQNYNRSKLVFT